MDRYTYMRWTDGWTHRQTDTDRRWCGNSQSYRTLSDKFSECPVKLKLNCIQSIRGAGQEY